MATENDSLHPRMEIEIQNQPNGLKSVFIAVHDTDLDIHFASGEEVLLYRASVDIHLGGLQRDVTFNVWKQS